MAVVKVLRNGIQLYPSRRQTLCYELVLILQAVLVIGLSVVLVLNNVGPQLDFVVILKMR